MNALTRYGPAEHFLLWAGNQPIFIWVDHHREQGIGVTRAEVSVQQDLL